MLLLLKDYLTTGLLTWEIFVARVRHRLRYAADVTHYLLNE